ncbi:natural product biosynthesis luciferase-like monooxygenase protein [Bradyrhizobium japonicum]
MTAGELGLNLLTGLTGHSIEELSAKIKSYRRAYENMGHAGKRGRVTVMMHSFIGRDVARVREQVRGPIQSYLRTNLGLHARQYERQMKRSGQLSPSDEQALLDHSFERYFKSASLLGTVESCMPVVDRLEAIGVDEIACLIDFGLEAETVLAGLEQLKVLTTVYRGAPAVGFVQGRSIALNGVPMA